MDLIYKIFSALLSRYSASNPINSVCYTPVCSFSLVKLDCSPPGCELIHSDKKEHFPRFTKNRKCFSRFRRINFGKSKRPGLMRCVTP